MSRHEIITELYASREVDECISRMVKEKYRPDFKQELFLIISSIDEILIAKLYTQKEIRYYVARIIINLSRQRNNVFHVKYLDSRISYDSDKLARIEMKESQDCIEDREKQEQLEIKMINRVHNLDLEMNTPAYRLMVMLVNKLGSQREVSRVTGVPVSVISRGIKKVRQRLCS